MIRLRSVMTVVAVTSMLTAGAATPAFSDDPARTGQGSATPLPDPEPPSAAPVAPTVDVPAPPVQAPDPQAAPEPDARTYTPYSETVTNPDGSRTATIYGAPAFTRTQSGWRRIEPRLAEAADAAYPYEVDGAARPLRLGRSRDALAQFGLPEGAVTISLRGATADRAPRRSGGRLRYDDVAPGVDLDVTFPPSGVRIDHVIAGPDSPRRYSYHISDPNGALGMPTTDPDGSIRFVGSDVRIEPPVAYESGASDEERADAGSAHHRIVAAGDGYDLEEWVDEEWLAGKSFPIVLDPTVTLTGAANGNTDCHIVNGGLANNVYCTSAVAEVGFGNSSAGNVIRRGLYQFPFDPLPAGAIINTATLSLLYTGFGGTAGTETVNVYEVLTGQLWTSPSWNNRITGGSTVAWSTAGGSPTGSIQASRAIPTTTTVNTRQTWTVTNLTRTLFANSALGQNRGMLLRSSAETTTRLVRFANAEDATSSRRPQLIVDYTPPTAPVAQAVAGDSSATVTWTHGIDNGNRTGYRITAWDGTTGTDVTAGPNDTSVVVPGLTNGVVYTFQVEPQFASGAGEVTWTGPVTPHAAPTVTAALTTPTRAGRPGVYARGQQLRMQVVVTSRESVTAPHSVTVKLPVLGASGFVTVDGVACSGALSCAIAPNAGSDELTVTGLQIGAGATRTIVVDFLPPGSDRACHALTFAAGDIVGANVLDGALAAATSAAIPFQVCDGGLGKEHWYSYFAGDVGAYGSAAVNVANGNLVVQHTDTTPVQAHGALALFTRRTYNSQDTTLLALPGSIGSGWTLNVGSFGLGGSLVMPTGLSVPSLAGTLTNPLAVTLVDRDGTRHRFAPRLTGLGLNAAGSVTGLAQGLLDGTAPSGKVHCVDVAYEAPAGVELYVYRYLLGDGSTCAAATNLAVAGFVAQRPDRLRTVFDSTGRITAMVDGAGNRLDYTYTSGRLTSVSERLRTGLPGRTISLQYVSSGIHADCGSATREVRITDPAGRLTRYCLNGDPLDLVNASYLLRVVNPDGGKIEYGYHAIAGANGTTPTCGAFTGQLCSVGNERGATQSASTSFTYSASDSFLSTMPRVATVTSRRGKQTTLGYHYDAAYVDADRAGRRTRWQTIDSHGRAGQLLQGAVNGSGISALRDSVFTWDTTGTGAVRCRQADDGELHHDLCSTKRKTLTLHAAYTSQGFPTPPDALVEYLYSPEGMVLRKRTNTANNGTGDVNLDTTYGYAVQSISSTGALTCYRDTIAGSGNVTTGTTPATCDSTTVSGTTGTRDADVLLAIVDQVESLTPRGNAATTDWQNYRTTVDVDADPAFGSNAVRTTPCTGTARGNSGLLCSAQQPRNYANFSTTYHEYDTYGQRVETTNPRGIATTYAYYADTVDDLSGTTSAGGWLKSVTDARSNFVVFAYDAAGNVVRTWDRNATEGTDVDAYASLTPAPPSKAYTETLRQALPGAGKTSYDAPWRWVVSEATALVESNTRAEHRTTYTVDRNGNVLTRTPPRGNSGYSNTGTGNPTSAYTTTQTFDSGDLRLTITLPVSTASMTGTQPATQFFYDDHGELDYEIDPAGHVRDHVYDSVGRQQFSYVSRGLTSDTTAAAYADGCADEASTSWLPAPSSAFASGTLICRTATAVFNGQDEPYLVADPVGYYTYRVFDGAGRETKTSVERIGGGPSSSVALHTVRAFDNDGNVIRQCTPRATTEGSNPTCAAPGRFGSSYVYQTGGLMASDMQFRSESITVAWQYGYDENGNRIAVTDKRGNTTLTTFDVLDRPVCVRTPRSSTETIYAGTEYDASGNAVVQSRTGGITACPTETAPTPVGRVTTYTYDTANRPVDTIDIPNGGESAQGGSDVKTRQYYDADGNVVGFAEPRAFAAGEPAATSGYITRVAYDEQGRRMTAYAPRSDTSTTPPGLTDTTGAAIGDQDAECPSNVTGYATATRVCVTRFRYDVVGNLARVWLPGAGGATTGTRHVDHTYTHDNLLRSTTSPAPTGSGASTATVSEYHNGRGEVVASVDALGNTTTYEYNGDGLLTEVTAPPNGTVTHTQTTTYDDNGNVATQTGFDGVTVTNTYTYDDLIWTTKTPDDRPGATPDPAGDIRSYWYDGNGNVTEVTSPAANASNTAYADSTATINVPTRTTYTRDNLPLVTVAPVSPDGFTTLRRTTYGYDTAGRSISETVETVSDSSPNWQSYTSTSTPTAKTLAYYQNDRLKSETGRDGTSKIEYEYDLAGNVTEAADSTATGATVTAAYYLDGLPRHVDAASRRTAYLYDGGGQPVARAYAPLTGGVPGTFAATRYTYDDAGAPFRMRSPVAASTGTGNGETLWEFDTGGRVSERTDPAGAVWTYTHANDDTLTSVDVVLGGNSVSKWQYTYDGGYRVATETQSGRTPTNTTFGPTTATYTYSPAGRLASFAMTGRATEYFEWDHNGNRLCAGADCKRGTIVPTGTARRRWTYRADDSIRNETAVGSTTAGPNYVYEPNGLLRNDGKDTTCYDTHDRLSHVKQNTTTTCPAASPTVSYTYDALGRQSSSTSAAITRSMFYDGASGDVVRSVLPTVTTEFALTPDGSVSAVRDGTAAPQFLLNDGGGNVTALVASAAVACQLRYDPFGEQLTTAGAAFTTCPTATSNDRWYRGARRDSTSGQYRLGARTYDPKKAGFLEPDGYGAAAPRANTALQADPATANRYSYVNGDPINYADPSGHEPHPVGGSWTGNGCSDGSCVVPPAPSPADIRMREQQPDHVPSPAEIRLMEEPCWERFACSARDFNGMTMDSRKAFLEFLNDRYAAQFNSTDWFNAIYAVLEFAEERAESDDVGNEGWEPGGSWFSIIDSEILAGIHDGFALALDMNVSIYTSEGEKNLYDIRNPGASKWASFLKFRRDSPKAHDMSLYLWSLAEQAATDHGVAMAEAYGAEPSDIQSLWFGNTQFYRNTLRSPARRAILNPFFPDFDPRDRGDARRGLSLSWKKTMAQWGFIEGMKNGAGTDRGM